jgi:hypothetical protein
MSRLQFHVVSNFPEVSPKSKSIRGGVVFVTFTAVDRHTKIGQLLSHVLVLGDHTTCTKIGDSRLPWFGLRV